MDEGKVLAAIERLDERMTEVRGEMRALSSETRSQIEGIRAEMATQFGEIRSGVGAQFDEMRGRFGDMARSSEVTALRLVMMERFERTEDKLNRLSDDLSVTMGAAMQNALARENDREETREITKLFYSMFALVRKL